MWESRVREQKDKVNLEGGEKTPFDEKAYIFDNEYSWTWALKGELPPPTAIVGRRDTVSPQLMMVAVDKAKRHSPEIYIADLCHTE